MKHLNLRPAPVQWWALKLQVAVQERLKNIFDETWSICSSSEAFASCLMLLGLLRMLYTYTLPQFSDALNLKLAS